ncbi:MAG: protein translocase subunit SecF, partial [Patescibacteria group bacterium]
MKRFLSWQVIAIIVLALGLSFFDASGETQKKIFPWTPEGVTKTKVHLGLDLQGGSQLDYKIDLRKVPEKEQESITNGVMEVIDKRVNGLGVSEPSIYLSKVGGEQHIIVELAEIKDLEKAKEIVGKTIQLEFKEQKTNPDPNEEKTQRNYAEGVLKKTLEKPENFSIIAEEESQSNSGKVRHDKGENPEFISKVDAKIKDIVDKLKPGEIYSKLIDSENEYVLGEDQELEQTKGVYILKLAEKKEIVRFEKQVDASHILIAYKGAKDAASDVTRTEEEAKKLAKDLTAKAKNSGDFTKLAQENSNDAGSKASGGVLTTPVNKDASYVPEFKEATLNLDQEGAVSDPVKSEFGYHIIKANKIQKDIKENQVKIEKIFISTMPDPWKDTGLTGEHFVHADMAFDQQSFSPYVSIKFNAEGAKLFEEITGRNIGKPIAIFVGGRKISAPNVQGKIPGGSATITGQFTAEYATTLARDLNTGAIPAPIILVGQHTIGSTLGQDALAKSVKAGAIGMLLVIIFMIAYYRLPGLIASIALGIYTLLMIFLVKSELPVWLSLLIGTAIFLITLYKILNSEEGNGEKFLSFILSIIILFFVSSVLSNPITLTLAGVAGIILSIGMAVDANILIFERTREEVHTGHGMISAIEKGFDRAWNSIRDSNFSSLITCAILFYFGSSLIRGFAINLAIGIVVSMFTAITVTRTLLRAVVKTKLAEKENLFVPEKKAEKKVYQIVEKTNLWMGISGTLISISLLALIFFGLKLGMDFTGGTFTEIEFKNKVAIEDFKKELGTIEDNLKGETAKSDSAGAAIGAPAQEPLDLKGAQVVASDEGSYQIKSKFISTVIHDKIIVQLKDKFGDLQEKRFETIGPTIGDAMKSKALLALAFALLMILIYLAFAFRKIPKRVNPWRFGACAIIALFHDLFITFGFFLILGKFANVEIDALFITALLTILGFSVHDTIVVFDRVRERLRGNEDKSIREIANISLTETMGRSINTSFSTLLTLIAMLIFGASSIFYFTLALTV